MTISYKLLLAMAIALGASAGGNLVLAQAQQGVGPSPSDTGTTSTTSLKDMLEKGLKARLPSEFEFARRVTEKVNEGKLPRKMVDSAFLWARYKKHPFEYFEFALRKQAKRINVAI